MTLRVAPLGGLGEIGMNCMAIEVSTEGGSGAEAGRGPMMLVDCGVSFPDREQGVDVIHPDFSYLEENRDRIVGLVITHGHEDHIGAIPYLLARLRVPIHAPPYALGLIRERLEEHPALVADPPELHPTRPRARFVLGDAFEIEPVRVTHSIADATALIVRTDAGTLVHTGDFKIDPTVDDDQPFDVEALTDAGRQGVDWLLSDSTNVDVQGRSRGEREVAETLERIIRGRRGRVLVTLFASNVHRLRALARIARATDRKIAFVGRSVGTHARVAQATGYLTLPPDLVVPLDHVALLPPENVLLICTGSQAEPRAALSRIALDDHPKVRLEPGDAVLLSSRAIPGNERAVMRMVSDLHRRGCEVFMHATDAAIHASGHAARDEQRQMIEWVSPRAFLPVHGTRHHLERHAQLARAAGVSDTLVIENGERAELSEHGSRKIGTFRTGAIAAAFGRDIAESVLRDRAALGIYGAVAAVAVVDGRGRCVGRPKLASRGVLDEVARWDLLAEAEQEVAASLDAHPWTSPPTDDELREVLRLAVRRTLGRELGPKPIVLPLVLRRD